MTRAYPLTDTQKSIIENNLDVWDTELCKLPGMENTTVRQVRDYRRRITRESRSVHRELADHIEQYIKDNGLPREYGAVISWAQYLRRKG